MTNSSAVREADPAHAVSPEGRPSANSTFHLETLRNPGYIVSNCPGLGEVLESMRVIDEGDSQSWYAAWKATADLALALAERSQEFLCKGRP